MAEWIKEHNPIICCIQETTHFTPKDTKKLKVKAWKMIVQVNTNPKRAGVAIINFRQYTLHQKKKKNLQKTKNNFFFFFFF